MDSSEIRELLLVAAAGLIARVMAGADAAELDSATLSEQIKVEDVDWRLFVTYSRMHRWVQISGKPMQAYSEAQLLAQLFGQGDGFQFVVPATWVPESAEIDARDRLR